MTSFAPKDPSKFSRKVGTVEGALNALGDSSVNVQGHTGADRIVVTGDDQRELVQSPALCDALGNISTNGGDLSTGGGNVVAAGVAATGDITVVGNVDGVDVSGLKPGVGLIRCTSTAGGGSFDALDASKLPGQLATLKFGSSQAGSGNVYLRNSLANQGAGGVNGWIQSGLNWAGSLIGVTVFAEVTAWTSGNMETEIYVRDGGASQTLLTTVTTTATGTGDIRSFHTFSAGTHSFAADSMFGVKNDMNNAGSMTTDDSTVVLYFLLSENVGDFGT